METKNIYQKLLEVQKEIKAIKKEQDNPFFKSKYFDVNAILAEVKPILSKHGLVLTQPIETDGQGRSVLVTSIADSESEKAIRSSAYLPDIQDPQKMGSAITYFRRYSIQALLSLEAEDDDGNVASEKVIQTESKKKWEPKKSADVFAHIKSQLKDLGIDPRTLKEADEYVFGLTGLKLQAVNIEEIESRLGVKIMEKEPKI